MIEKVSIPNTKNYFSIYKKDEHPRATIIICPGGGYKYTSTREGECVALKFLEAGFHAVVLYYREELQLFPGPMVCLAYTIDYLRRNTDTKQIITLGFSAGGHVVASLGCHYKRLKNYDCRPDLQILCYPVITTNPKYSHKGSFKELLGENINDKKLLKDVSLEYQVKKTTPETFIWHTATDQSVPVENSLLFVKALRQKNISVEFHMYPIGAHGLSLANEETAQGDPTKLNPYIGRWLSLVIEYINYKLN